MRQTALNCVYELAKKDERIVFVGSDLGTGVLDKFKSEMPERFLMEGISEQNLIGMSAGLAMEGKIPYVNTIATFLTRRCFEQIVLDLCLHNQKVRLISSGGGVVYAPLGPTHLAIEDIAILRAVPNIHIFAPADAEEMKRLIPHTVDLPGPVYIRVAKGGDPIVTNPNDPFAVGKVFELRRGKDVLLVTTGITAKIATDSATELSKKGIECTIVHVPTLKPFPAAAIAEYAAGVRGVVTIEEHVIIGGLGSAVTEVLCDVGVLRRVKRIGIADEFPHEYGSQESLMKSCGITSENVVKAALVVLG